MDRLAFAALALVACSTDTFTGGTDSGGTGDGGSTADAIAEDATTTSDACASAPACAATDKCSAFDDLVKPLGPFTDGSQNGGTVGVSSDQHVSCPHSLVIALPTSSAASSARAVIAASAGTASVVSAHTKLALDVFLPKAITGFSTILSLFANNDPSAAVTIEAQTSGQYSVRMLVSNEVATFTPLTGAWNHFVLDVTFDAVSKGQASITYLDENGNQQTKSITNSDLPGATATVTSLACAIGIAPFNATTGPMTMYVDDVVFSPE